MASVESSSVNLPKSVVDELILKVFLNRDFYSGMVMFTCRFLYSNNSNGPALSLTEVAELYCDTNPF